MTRVRRFALRLTVPLFIAGLFAAAVPLPAAAGQVASCTLDPTLIIHGSVSVEQLTVGYCDTNVPVITIQTCLNYQIFLWSGDQYCTPASAENWYYAEVDVYNHPAHQKTYRIHAKMQITPPPGVGCLPSCTVEDWTNGQYYP
jgi:hypothetical protein